MMTDQTFWQWVWHKNSIIKKYGPAGPPLVLRYIAGAQRVLNFWQTLTFRLNTALSASAGYAPAGVVSVRNTTAGAACARNSPAGVVSVRNTTAGAACARNAPAGVVSVRNSTVGAVSARYAPAGPASARNAPAGPASTRYVTAGVPSPRYATAGQASAGIRAVLTLPEAAAFFREYPCAVTVFKERQELMSPAETSSLRDASIKIGKLFPSQDIERYTRHQTLQTLAFQHNKALRQVRFSQASAAASLLTIKAFYSPVSKSLVSAPDSQWPITVGGPMKVASPMTIKPSVTTMHKATAMESSVAVKQTPDAVGYATEAIRDASAVAGGPQNSALQLAGFVTPPLTSRGKGSIADADVPLTNTPGYRLHSALVSHTVELGAHALEYTTAAVNIPSSIIPASAAIVHKSVGSIHASAKTHTPAITTHKPTEIRHTPAMTIHEPAEIKHISAITIHEPAEIKHAAAKTIHKSAGIIHASAPVTTNYKPATIVQVPEDSTAQGITAPSTASAADISRLAEQVYRVIEGKLTREKERRGR